MNIKHTIFLLMYYGFARFLPPSYKSKTSKKIRYLICKNIFLECGVNVNVERKAWFGKGDKIIIGDNSGIGINGFIRNNTVIGDNVMMGPNCYLLASAHGFSDIDVPMRLQGRGGPKPQVIIKDDVWIGRDVMIIGNKIIEKGTIIGARTNLTKNFPPYSIVGGNPSKLIRSRIEDKFKS